MILGLVGYIGSGKGTVADILVRHHHYRKFAFADALKDSISVIFGWDRHLLEGDTNASRAFRERIDPWWSHKFGFEVTPRLIMQKMGTEACRNGIADNIWIAALEKRIQDHKNVVISDVRFSNEVDFIRSVGGTVIRVKRGEDPSIEERKKMHSSETDWNNVFPDAIIENNGTIDQLKDDLSNILTILDKQYRMLHTL